MCNSNWCIKAIHFVEQNFGHYLIISFGYSLRDIEFFIKFSSNYENTSLLQYSYYIHRVYPLLGNSIAVKAVTQK